MSGFLSANIKLFLKMHINTMTKITLLKLVFPLKTTNSDQNCSSQQT